MESRQNNQGAKIHLVNLGSNTFLPLGSTREVLDILSPFISRDEESDLRFIAEDIESNTYQNQMTLSQTGELKLDKLVGSFIRNLVVDSDGSFKAQDFGGHAGVLPITAHDFISYDNPGDDHNFNFFLKSSTM